MSEFFSDPQHQPFALGHTPGQAHIGALLIHGFPGTPAEMRPLGERLAAAGWAVRGPLLPGFGPQIPTLGDKTRHDWLTAVRHAWQQVRAAHETAVLIGFSMGGALALHLAAGPQPPDGLVLLAPFWRLAGWQGNLLPIVKHFRKTFYPFAQANFGDTAVRQQLHELMPDADLDDTAVQARIRQEAQLPTRTIDEVRRLGLESIKLAAEVHCPTLVLQGSEDTVVLPRFSRQLITRLGGPVTYREIPGKHTFPKMQPTDAYDFTPEIFGFVAGVNRVKSKK